MVVLTHEDHERIATLAAAKTFGLIKDFLTTSGKPTPQIQTNRAYLLKEVAELFDVTTHTIRRWCEDDKHCLLRKVENVNKFSGHSVMAEFKRRNGIQ